MWWIPLLTTAAGLGYEVFFARPERERIVREEVARREREYQKWLGEYQKFLETPIQAYPPEAIQEAMRGIEETLARQIAVVRPRLLEELEARQVRGAGIAEYPLGRVEEERARILGEARRGLEIERLLADYRARQQRGQLLAQLLTGQMGTAYTPFEQARQMEFMSPFYTQQLIQELLGLGGAAAAYYLAGRQPTARPSPLDPWERAEVLRETYGEEYPRGYFRPEEIASPGARTL